MADIDKALPNVETEIKVPGQEEIVEAQQETIEEQVGPEDIQVTQEEDGGATINFDPEAVNQPGGESHFDNLAELLPEEVLGKLGSELAANYNQYKSSRKDWEDSYTKGLDLLGFKYENPTQPFKEQVVQLTQCLQKLLHNFKRKLTKNYYRLMVQYTQE